MSLRQEEIHKIVGRNFKIAVFGYLCDSVITFYGVRKYGVCNEGNPVTAAIFRLMDAHFFIGLKIYISNTIWTIFGIAALFYLLLPRLFKKEQEKELLLWSSSFLAALWWFGTFSWIFAFLTGSVIYCP